MTNPNERKRSGLPGRPKTTVERVDRHVKISKPLMDELEVLLHDPFRDRIRYGSLSNLINALIAEHLETRRRQS